MAGACEALYYGRVRTAIYQAAEKTRSRQSKRHRRVLLCLILLQLQNAHRSFAAQSEPFTVQGKQECLCHFTFSGLLGRQSSLIFIDKFQKPSGLRQPTSRDPRKGFYALREAVQEWYFYSFPSSPWAATLGATRYCGHGSGLQNPKQNVVPEGTNH